MEANTPVRARDTHSSEIRHFLSKQVQEKIAQHPCYSKNAHQYARMHLPVAPACNIQCHYCNRKYDCSNESRPGVVSRVASPDIALKQFATIKKRAPNLTVVGIAGPGDALANPDATFSTLTAIRQADPDVQLCISTNGLMLAPYVDELVAVGVSHLTITINCTDPDIGSQIYPWIYFNHQRLRGREAAKTLIEQQFAGLKAAADAGMLVKVNTVLIPGVNDHHIKTVSEAVKAHGALLHNIMPLISDPAHGTWFGLTHQRGPTDEELAQARTESGDYMPQMTHCQQCRADAVGVLGGCSSSSESPEHPEMAENTTSSPRLRIAVAASDDSGLINTHFGHAKWFEIYEYSAQSGHFGFIENRSTSQYCSDQHCDDDFDEKERIIRSVSDCDMVLCARMGITPWRQLEKLGVRPNVDFAYQATHEVLPQMIQDQINQSQQNTTTSTERGDHEVCNY
ncbi:FeMo cofactor biosynthesis protein NifB [Vibrio aerogenes CECT 7868]|uniref:FeMo cofactor biosynthesis protein NifB n=1 Tax=Vibrio aerogenes CECT 7868 TaxID=1216006 RepID=A0A1M5WWT1_9VIBR|nr:nitrogenase cofactor biosynthesis protein NifB [Vibrio aerogenes]SHH91951.1 FeMo cofactor biosynthesis protein NifB [Vibrio aerogenes CECT 7868]